jgi:dihydrofolate synthase/folylpolyglutamate synthase
MLQGVANTPHRNLHIVYGCVNDKDYLHILQLLNSSLIIHHPSLTWYFSQPSVPRRLPVTDLQSAALRLGIHGDAFQHVKQAISAARAAASPDDLVLVTGSIFLVADALQ